jgi:hypothetical protein
MLQLGCAVGVDARTCTTSFRFHHDPYCLLDPTCVSPTFNQYQHLYGQGLAIVYGDPTRVLSNARMLAVPNFCLFVLIFAGLVALVFMVPIDSDWHRPALAAPITWYILELIRWGDALWQFPGLAPARAVLGSPYTYMALCVVAIPLAGATVLARSLTTDSRH